MTAQERGRRGEAYARSALERQGVQILTSNYNSRYGEIDLIAKEGEYLLFVEVRTRAAGGMVKPAESVGIAKQKRIISTAYCYLEEYPCDLQPRFDLFCLTMDQAGNIISQNYLKGAFDGEAYGE